MSVIKVIVSASASIADALRERRTRVAERRTALASA